MKILLLSATNAEIRPLLEKFTCTGETVNRCTPYLFHTHKIDVIISGIGMVPTTYYLGIRLISEKYDIAINAGICGCFHTEPPLGSVINIVEDCFSEVGAEDHSTLLTNFELGLEDPEEYPFRAGKLINEIYPETPVITRLPKLKGITVNTIHGRKNTIEFVRKKFNPDTESMEGAAFFYACFMNNLPCLQIRSISNLIEVRNKANWNLDLSLKNLNNTLLKILQEL